MGIAPGDFDTPPSKICEVASLFQSPNAPLDRFRPPLAQAQRNRFL
jgi:hypothetical protein